MDGNHLVVLCCEVMSLLLQMSHLIDVKWRDSM